LGGKYPIADWDVNLIPRQRGSGKAEQAGTEPAQKLLRIGQDTFRPHPLTGPHNHQFSVCRDHDAAYQPRGHIDVAYQRRFPDVGLVQLRPGPKLGRNDFLSRPESLVANYRRIIGVRELFRTLLASP
jgi:hypothetical protein